MAKAATTAFNISLAQEVENYPPLWDISMELYKRIDLKPSLWEEVAQKVNARHDSLVFTADSAKKRFKDLEENFVKNQRKVHQSQTRCSGKGTDEMYVPVWPVFKYLLYLKKTCAQAESVSNLESISLPISCEDNNNISVIYVQDGMLCPDSPPPLPPSCNAAEIPPTSTTTVVQSNQSNKRDVPPTFFTPKGESKKSNSAFFQHAVKVLEKLADEPEQEPKDTKSKMSPIVSLIDERLKEMDQATRKLFENDLLDVLRKY